MESWLWLAVAVLACAALALGGKVLLLRRAAREIAEGFAREVISKLQTMRKEAGFEVVDRIHVTVKTADEKLAQIVAQNAEAIERGVLALDVKLGDAPEGAYVRDWSINGVDATLSVLKA